MARAKTSAAPLRGFFPSRDGHQLYHEIWPASGAPRARVVIVHGYGDHCGRFQNPVTALTRRGLDVLTFDYRGHGQAAGVRGHIDRFSEYVDDLESALSLARKRGSEPLFVVGHSLGGLIAARTVIERRPHLTGLVLSSPFIGFRLRIPLLKGFVAVGASRLTPRLALGNPLSPTLLSRDPAVGQAYARDRFVHRVATARWFTETRAAQARTRVDANSIDLPLLAFHGDADGIADHDVTKQVVARSTAADKTFTSYPGGYHELMNDLDKDLVLRDLGDWLEAHS